MVKRRLKERERLREGEKGEKKPPYFSGPPIDFFFLTFPLFYFLHSEGQKFCGCRSVNGPEKY
jgi:hypothetical protein